MRAQSTPDILTFETSILMCLETAAGKMTIGIWLDIEGQMNAQTPIDVSDSVDRFGGSTG
jgi:hypothetical protein